MRANHETLFLSGLTVEPAGARTRRFWKTRPREAINCHSWTWKVCWCQEIWIAAVAEKTGIRELRLTTRDVPDYDVLMKDRLNLLDQHGLKLSDIQKGHLHSPSTSMAAAEFLDELRSLTQVLILSDTFEEFAHPAREQRAGLASFLPQTRSRKRSHYQLPASVSPIKSNNPSHRTEKIELPRHRRR